MEEHSIPVADLILPILLPLGEGIFLKEAVGTDDKHRSSSLKAYSSLDADDCIADMTVASDTVGGSYFLYCLYGFYLVLVCNAIDGT